MNLSRLERASDFEVKEWLEEELQLTEYQKSRIWDRELIRFAPFYFYKPSKKKGSFIWRLTLPVFCVYYILAVASLPINFLATGHWGYGRGFYDKFHAPWVKKLGL